MDKVNRDQKVTPHRYYVAKCKTILGRLVGKCKANIGSLQEGMLIEVLKHESDYYRIRVNHPGEPWLDTEWKGCKYDYVPVSKRIWYLLEAIPSSMLSERMRLVNNKQLCKDIEDLTENSKVWYCDECSVEPCAAIVKYIGCIPEYGPGHYFGLCLMNENSYEHSQNFTRETRYNGSKILCTLSAINVRKSGSLEGITKFEENFLLNDFQSGSNSSFFNSKLNTNINDHKRKVESDNNNEQLEALKISTNYVNSIPSVNDNKKLYNHLKDFDPLHSEEELSEKIVNLNQVPNGDLNIGSNVKVQSENDTLYGVIRWIGTPSGSSKDKVMAAIELLDNHPLGTDGTYNDTRYFSCDSKKAYFTDIRHCHQFDIASSSNYSSPHIDDFECKKSNIIPGAVSPITVNGNLEKICGDYRGIQGHHNSCYLDATLFSMFAFTSVFDSLLFRPPNNKDCPQYQEVQRVLREEIVNPLRKEYFVGADHVMKLRKLLEKFSSVSGLTSEEKDPEEFLTSLVAQILNAEPYLKLSSGQEAFHYQLFVEKDDGLKLPTVQQLLEQSFFASNIKLKEVPSCLIIQMPRFGKSFKMYQKIQPTLFLDVTDIIEDSPRECIVCGELAVLECRKCYAVTKRLDHIAFCEECIKKVHRNEERKHHDRREFIPLTVPDEFRVIKNQTAVPRLYLELLAVVCIETSHYVSFVKCGRGADAPWCFFDSMADRKGEQNGFNIPKMVPCPDFPLWLKEGESSLNKMTDDRKLPEYVKRLLCDAYMCMYQSLDVMMYK